MADATVTAEKPSITYRMYRDERDLPLVMQLIDNELSEPYSIFTYRYFLRQWPQLCFFAEDGEHTCGVVVCKQEQHRELLRGYLAMLVVDKKYRAQGVGSSLVRRAIAAMTEGGCEEVVLEAEVGNRGALALYQKLGFIRDKRLHRYYLSNTDAFRLKLLLPLPPDKAAARGEEGRELHHLHGCGHDCTHDHHHHDHHLDHHHHHHGNCDHHHHHH